MATDERCPIVHVLVARPLPWGAGRVLRMMVVDLETAAWMKDEGWWVVGPDLEDVDALSQWERSQDALAAQEPFNRPRGLR